MPRQYKKTLLYLIKRFISTAHVKPKHICLKGLHLALNKNIVLGFKLNL